jgi:hypothetical protein
MVAEAVHEPNMEVDYISVACNKTTQASDWSQDDGTLAYAAHHSIALYNPLVCLTIG